MSAASDSKDTKSVPARKSEFATVKVNNVKVGGIPKTGSGNEGLVRGADLFREPYGNIVLGGKKKSGKTWVIFEIIKACATPETTLYLFVGTVHKDQSWLDIQAWLKKHKIPFIARTELGKNAVDLDDIIKGLQQDKDENEKEVEDADIYETVVLNDNSEMYQTVVRKKPKPKVKKPPKPKYQPLDNMFIFDDLGKALRAKPVATLMKQNRHFKSKTIISTHDYADLDADARPQGDYYLLFPQWSEKRLKMVFESMGLSISFETFLKLYYQATSESHQFLYVETANDQFRKNFDTKLVVPLSEGAQK